MTCEPRFGRYWLGIAFMAAGLGFWEVFARASFSTSLIPPVSEVARAWVSIAVTPSFHTDLAVTLLRVALGYAIGSFFGMAVGVLMGFSRIVDATLHPTVEVLRPIPASALVPVAILFFGLDTSMVVAIVAYAAAWPVLLNSLDGVRGVNPTLVATGQVLGYSRSQLLRRVLLPASLPQMFTGLRISLALSLVLSIVVEMLVGDRGLGHRLITAERTFRFAEMYATILSLGAIGVTLNALFLLVRRRVVRWYVLGVEASPE